LLDTDLALDAALARFSERTKGSQLQPVGLRRWAVPLDRGNGEEGTKHRF
jgi:hypothetical protein